MATKIALYGLIIFFCNEAMIGASVLSPLPEEDASIRIFNPGHDLGSLEYAVKRGDNGEDQSTKERRHDDRLYFRLGRSQGDGGSSNYGQSRERAEFPVPSTRGKLTDTIRYGRSDLLKFPRSFKNAFEKKSARENFIRFGRNTGIASVEARMAILCPNVLLDEDARDNKNLQRYLPKLMYICGKNNVVENEESEDNDTRQDDIDSIGINGEPTF